MTLMYNSQPIGIADMVDNLFNLCLNSGNLYTSMIVEGSTIKRSKIKREIFP